jgi:hypothetical protein
MWQKRRNNDEAFTFNQIAALVLDSGNSTNASVIGQTVNQYQEYFINEQRYKWRANWEAIRQDHPHLFTDGASRPGELRDPIQDMLRALNDEIRDVRKKAEERPIIAFGLEYLGVVGQGGSFLYRATLDLESDDELPIPEGVGVLLKWEWGADRAIVEATLLNYDALESKIIVETEKPLAEGLLRYWFKVFPRTDELLKSVRARVELLRAFPCNLAKRLIEPNLYPKPISWTHEIDGRGLDGSQRAAVTRCLNQDITFIWGPPGTGKTHTLARLIANAVFRGKRVLAVTIANVAIDQLALEVVKALKTSGRAGFDLLESGHVVRYGYPRLKEVSAEKRLFPQRLEIQRLRRQLYDLREKRQKISKRNAEALALNQKAINDVSSEIRRLVRETLANARIILTTAVQTCIEEELSKQDFDLVVIDEASMMPIPYALVVSMHGHERLVIAGDFRQLGPIAVSQSQVAYEWLHRDVYALHGVNQDTNHQAVAMLMTQRRMHKDICELINGPFYAGKLITHVSSSKTVARELEPLPGKVAVLVDLKPEDGTNVEKTDSGSRRNEASALLALYFALNALQASTSISVGIVSPYRAQVSLLRRRLEECQLKEDLLNRIKLGTIHAFQGSEDDVIIWDLVDDRISGIGRLYRDETGNRLVNVALSRAKGKLIIIGDKGAFISGRGSELVRGFRAILAQHFSTTIGNVIAAGNVKKLDTGMLRPSQR